jgi:hypothetical protein
MLILTDLQGCEMMVFYGPIKKTNKEGIIRRVVDDAFLIDTITWVSLIGDE